MAGRGVIRFARGEAIVQPIVFSPASDVSAWPVLLTVKAPGSTIALLSLTVGSGLTLLNDNSGWDASFTSTQTLALQEGNLRFDLWRTDTQRLLLTGTIEITGSVRYD